MKRVRSVWRKGQGVRIIVENLKYLIENKGLTFPIDIKVLSERHAVIDDVRIPDEWYANHFCTVCTPIDLLPLPQKLSYERKIKRGDIQIIEVDGISITKVHLNPSVQKLKAEYTMRMRTVFDPPFVYAPFIPDEC